VENSLINTAALAVVLALAAGVVTQSLARHLHVPGIVLLLGAGVLLGPEVAGLIQPSALGSVLPVLVGLAVAVILFEGGMSLNLSRLRRQSKTIRMLVTAGVIVTAIGATLAARVLLAWQWGLSALFGTLVVVTGPTVIQPLLRRVRVKRNVKTVLEAEAVFIDAIGATLAVVTLSIVVNPSGGSFASGLALFVLKIGSGFLFGLIGGLVIAGLLSLRRAVPEGLENVFTLSLVLALYQVSHSIFPESGIVAVTIAGLIVGNVRTRTLPELKEFKEQLTIMFVGMLFVLLAADVRLEEVSSLGWGGLYTVLALMFIVRPLNVAISTAGSQLTIRERTFLSWLAPRGIVAAAVASLFAQELAQAGIPGGKELRALVFLVIAITVLVQGFSGGMVAHLLGVRRRDDNGFVILGASDLGLALGRVLGSTGEEVVFIDASPHASHRAEEAGFRVIFGNALEEGPLHLVELDSRAGCIGVTPNEEVNLLFAAKAISDYRVPRAYVALRVEASGITPDMVRKAGATLLFGAARDVELWSLRFNRAAATVEEWEWAPADSDPVRPEEVLVAIAADAKDSLLPMAVYHGERMIPIDDGWQPRRGTRVHFAILEESREEARALLNRLGWTPVPAAKCTAP